MTSIVDVNMISLQKTMHLSLNFFARPLLCLTQIKSNKHTKDIILNLSLNYFQTTEHSNFCLVKEI